MADYSPHAALDSTSGLDPETMISGSDPFSHAHSEVESEKYVVFVNPERRYVECSPDVCELLGYSEDEILSKTIDQLSFFTSEAPEVFERFVQQGALDGLYLLRHKNGRPVTIRYRAWDLPDGCLAAAWEPADRWQQAYHAALLELNPARTKSACEYALAEIEFQRFSGETNGTATEASRHDLDRAATALRRKLLHQI